METETQPRVRMVVADDSPKVRAALIRYLGSVPALVVVGEASDGDEALRRVEELSPDLLLLDLHIPKRSGLEVLEVLQARKTEVNILVLSAYGPDHYDLLVRELGAVGFVAKGDPEALVDAIQRLNIGG